MKTEKLGINHFAAGLTLLAAVSVCSGTAALAEEADPGIKIIMEDEYTENETEPATAAETEWEPEEENQVLGNYQVAKGWSEDSELSKEDIPVYRQDAFWDTDETSTITCSYLDTNYPLTEYEQLREMLTNNLLYENVDAQISTSALYTLAKDYLYIIVVDDPAKDYRNIYNYVIGNYCCFCVQVKEYRDEAAEAEVDPDRETPQEAGQKMAEGFVWEN